VSSDIIGCAAAEVFHKRQSVIYFLRLSFHHHQVANNIGFRNSGAGKLLSRAMLITSPIDADNHRVRKIDASSGQLFEAVSLLLLTV
jgi:hypothetical protein